LGLVPRTYPIQLFELFTSFDSWLLFKLSVINKMISIAPSFIQAWTGTVRDQSMVGFSLVSSDYLLIKL